MPLLGLHSAAASQCKITSSAIDCWLGQRMHNASIAISHATCVAFYQVSIPHALFFALSRLTCMHMRSSLNISCVAASYNLSHCPAFLAQPKRQSGLAHHLTTIPPAGTQHSPHFSSPDGAPSQFQLLSGVLSARPKNHHAQVSPWGWAAATRCHACPCQRAPRCQVSWWAPCAKDAPARLHGYPCARPPHLSAASGLQLSARMPGQPALHKDIFRGMQQCTANVDVVLRATSGVNT
jgi:hypothetical protein